MGFGVLSCGFTPGPTTATSDLLSASTFSSPQWENESLPHQRAVVRRDEVSSEKVRGGVG